MDGHFSLKNISNDWGPFQINNFPMSSEMYIRNHVYDTMVFIFEWAPDVLMQAVQLGSLLLLTWFNSNPSMDK